MAKKPLCVLMLSILSILILLAGCGAAGKGNTGKSAAVMAETDRTAIVQGIALDERAAVITDTVADIFSEPDVKSERLTQAFYNQPVTILEEKNGWCRVDAVDGNCGWIRSKFVDRNVSSLKGENLIHKIIVTSRDKSIFSDPTNGITVKDVVMGTEFFAFNTSGTAFEVYLPGNRTGWLRGSGIIHVGINEDAPLTTREDFVSTALKFKGISYLVNGMSSLGIDAPGMVYVCANINGINLPRNIVEQLAAGSEASLDSAREGDLVFLTPKGDDKTAACVGICIGGGKFIYASRTAGYVKTGSLSETNSDGKPAFVRRIFE